MTEQRKDVIQIVVQSDDEGGNEDFPALSFCVNGEQGFGFAEPVIPPGKSETLYHCRFLGGTFEAKNLKGVENHLKDLFTYFRNIDVEVVEGEAPSPLEMCDETPQPAPLGRSPGLSET